MEAQEWTYRGEGAVNLVLAYNGTRSDLVCLNFAHFRLLYFTPSSSQNKLQQLIQLPFYLGRKSIADSEGTKE